MHYLKNSFRKVPSWYRGVHASWLFCEVCFLFFRGLQSVSMSSFPFKRAMGSLRCAEEVLKEVFICIIGNNPNWFRAVSMKKIEVSPYGTNFSRDPSDAIGFLLTGNIQKPKGEGLGK